MQFVSLSAFPKSGVTYLSSLLFYTFFPSANPDDIERRYVVDIHINDCSQAVGHEDRIFFKNHYARDDHRATYPAISKVIYLIRDPIDIMRSAYDFLALVGTRSASLSLDQFAEEWVRTSGGGFESSGTWPHHVRSWLEQSEVPTLLVDYTTLVDRPSEQLGRIFGFLDLQPSDAAIDYAIASSSMGAMRAREEDEFQAKRQGVFYSETVAKAMSEGARFINKGYRGSHAALDDRLKELADKNFGGLRRKYLS